MEGLTELSFEETRRRLAQLYRYVQVGRCVSSVTHDINNVLGAILAYAELIKMSSELTPDSSRMLQEIVNGVKKCSNLVNNLTAAARKDRPNVSTVNPAELIRQVLDFRRHDLKVRGITLETEVAEDLSDVVVDLSKVKQALLYILSNAIEELEHVESRTLRVSTCRVDGCVEIGVWNSAPPIPEEVRGAIFQPFQTTKKGDHLGLGLYLAREIARTQEGDLFYTPERGFVLRVPCRNSRSLAGTSQGTASGMA